MRSQSRLEIPLNPTRKRSWCSSVFGFGVDVGVGVDDGVDVGVDVGVVSSVIFVNLPTNGHYDFYKTWKSIPLIKRYRASYFTFTIFSRLRLSSFPLFGSCPSSNVTRWPTSEKEDRLNLRRPSELTQQKRLVTHIAHAASRRHCRCRLWLRLLGHHCFGGDKEARNGGGIL